MKKAYTLIEILMVMAIIGIIMAFSAVAFLSARKTARDARRKTDLEQIRGALETYKADNNVYPGSLSTPVASSGEVTPTLGSYLVTQYIGSLPVDPISTLKYYYVVKSNGYALCSYLEAGAAVVPSDCTDAICGDISGVTKNCNYAAKNP